jgi:hypothetical protein
MREFKQAITGEGHQPSQPTLAAGTPEPAAQPPAQAAGSEPAVVAQPAAGAPAPPPPEQSGAHQQP